MTLENLIFNSSYIFKWHRHVSFRGEGVVSPVIVQCAEFLSGDVVMMWSTPPEIHTETSRGNFLQPGWRGAERDSAECPAQVGPGIPPRCSCWWKSCLKTNESYSRKGMVFLSWFEVGDPINPRNYIFFGCKWKRETPLLDEFYRGIRWNFASCFHSLHYDGDLQLFINCLIVLEASGPLSVWEMFLWEYWTQKWTELRHSSKHMLCIRHD